MTRLDLTRQAREAAVSLTEGPPLSEDERLRAIATWRGRMVNEHVSARVFAALVPQLMRAEVDADALAEVAMMIEDELRHGRQCAAMVHALGGEAVAELPPLADVPDHADAGPLEAVLRNVLSISCLSETVAVALIRAEHQEVGPPEMKQTLAAILADEVRHARFGWTLLRAVDERLKADAGMRERLGAYLVTAFAHLEAHELAHLPEGPTPSAAVAAVGVCDGRDARRLFYDTVASVIVPGLERHGLPARAAWEARA